MGRNEVVASACSAAEGASEAQREEGAVESRQVGGPPSSWKYNAFIRLCFTAFICYVIHGILLHTADCWTLSTFLKPSTAGTRLEVT